MEQKNFDRLNYHRPISIPVEHCELLAKYHGEIIHHAHSTLIVSQSGVLVLDEDLNLNIDDSYLHYQPHFQHIEVYKIDKKYHDSNSNTILIAKELPAINY